MAKKAQKPSPLNQSAARLGAIKNKLRGSKNVLADLSTLRGSLDIPTIQPIIDWLPALRHNGRPLIVGRKLTSVRDLINQRVLAPAPADVEYEWAISVFRNSIPDINGFIKRSGVFERLFSEGEYHDALTTLDEWTKCLA